MFGDVMRAHRLQLAITQEELAVKAGLGVRTVRDIEAGRIGRPRQGTVRALADVLALQGAEREHFYAAAFSEPERQVTAPEVSVERIDLKSTGSLVGSPVSTLNAPAASRKAGESATRSSQLTAFSVGVLLVAGISLGVNVYNSRVMEFLSPGREPVHISVQEQPDGAQSEAPPPYRLGRSPGVRGRWAFSQELDERQTLDELNNLAGSETVGSWAARKGGFELGSTNLRLVLQGADPDVEIVNVRARVVRRVAIPRTTLVMDFQQEDPDDTLSSGNKIVKTSLNLDLVEPSASHFLNNTIPLQPHRSVVIDLLAHITKGAVVWDVAVDMVVAGKKKTMIVMRGDGLHFQTAAYPDQKSDRTGAAAPRFPYEEYQQSFLYDRGQDPPSWKACVPQECLVSVE